MNQSLKAAVVSAAVALAFSMRVDAFAEDWPGLRGPRHDGAARGALAGGDGAGFAVAWRAALGAGYSSVAVAEGRAVTLFTDGVNDQAAAFDAQSGRELWRYAIAPTLRGKDGSFDGPIATPWLADGRVFGLGPRGHLFALDAASGRELWKVDLVAREGAVAPHYGFTASPVVAGGVVVALLGAKDGGAVAGFDPATGARRFRIGNDSVAYQTPVVAAVGGREQLVVVGDTKLLGIDPASGRLLFEHAHGGEVHPIASESIVPVPAGDGRLFLKYKQDASTMLRLVAGPGGATTVETLWTEPVLRSTYVVPVYHDGFLYGMNGRAALTCVDAATGAVRWRSREPGDGFPMLVGGDLVILTKQSTLHVGKASPEGWSERARLPVFGDVAWSPPGYAEGAVFVRGQKEVARVDWRAGGSAAAGASGAGAATAAPAPASKRFARFLAEAEGAQDKTAAVDSFLASLPPGPLVEWPDSVVFLYRGAAKDAGIAGDMNGDRREDPMWRVPGTDLFWYETRLEPDARINYHLVRDFEERFPDPRNPWRVPGPRFGNTLGPMPQDQSSLAMPGWRAPDHLGEPAASRRGRLEAHVVPGSRPGSKLPVTVYLPRGYDQGRERLPLALVLDGDQARELGLVAQSLDNLIPERVAPVVVAFVGRPDWGEKPPSPEEREDALVGLLAKDAVGFLEARYRIDGAPERRAVIGTGSSGATAATVVFRHPGLFGALGMQSVVMLDTDGEALLKQVPKAALTPLRVYLDWGLYDRRATREAWDMRVTNARFAAYLRERGYKPAGGEVPEGAGWAGWRNRTDRVFGTLFPPPQPTRSGPAGGQPGSSSGPTGR